MRKSTFSRRTLALRAGVSLMTLGAMVTGGAVWAQGAPANGASANDGGQEVVVVGVRRALKSAQDIKKNADTQVDSITATDIGAFPDKSVAEALQRVPGITVSRFQSSDDSTHFSAEPAQVLIRGLTQVRTEFNGRDSFSADASRGLNFNDISPELMAGVDSYKNQTAEMTEGGIAGSVNLRTRLPFDSKGQVISLSAKGDYGDRTKKTTYEYSGIYSNRWQTSVGEFGLMLDYANSHVLTETDGVVMQRIGAFCSAGYSNASGIIVNSDGSIPCTSNPYGGNGWVYMPDQVNYSQVTYDRNRHGTALAAQYQNNDKTFLATLQYNDSYYRNAWFERSVNPTFFGLWAAPAFSPQTVAVIKPADGTPAFTFGADGMLESGVLTQPTGDWGGSTQQNINYGSAVPGLPFVNYCGTGSACTTQREGVYIENQARDFNHSEGTRDISLNVKWDVSDQLKTNFDVQHITAETNNYDILVANDTMANAQYSVNGDGTPIVKLLPGSNINYAPGFISNLHNYFPHFIQDHYEDNDADETALRADADYRFKDAGWLNSLKVGVRYADREQTVRYSSYNWSPVAANWNCNGPGFNIDNTTPAPYPVGDNCSARPDFKGYGAGIWAVDTLNSGFYDGNVFPNAAMAFISNETLKDHDGLIKALSGSTTNSPMAWTPLCQRTSNTDGCFVPAEELDVSEKTTAAYVMLRFGGADKTIFNGITVNGNVGVRYVQTEDQSHGSVALTNKNWYQTLPACTAPTSSTNLLNVSCYLNDDLKKFGQGQGVASSYGAKHQNWLPSFNVRFGLDDKQFIRFGASRALSRPDFGQLRNVVQIAAPAIDTSPTSRYIVWKNAAGSHTDPTNVAGYNFVFTADSGNGALAPITADQFDLSYENYFTSTSSFTADLFFKKLNGEIAYAKLPRSITLDGATEPVLLSGPGNTKGGGELQGIEIAYQTFFDFLPGLWSGLGLQANYTHTHQSGIHNSNLANEPGYASGGTVAFGGGLQIDGSVFDSHRLAGISDDSYNIVGLYEKGPIAARVAYSWRSKFLTNNLDCCIGLPMYQKASGFLDASIRYKLSDNVELSLDGSNLLDTTTTMQQQVMGDSATTPGAAAVLKDSAWIRNDRRYQVGIRLKY